MTRSKHAKGDKAWAEAKKKCHLNQDEINMAKAVGLNPRKLIANNSSCQQQPWKEPVKDWIRSLYEKRFRQNPPQNEGDQYPRNEAPENTQ